MVRDIKMRYKYKLEGKIPENKTEIKGGTKQRLIEQNMKKNAVVRRNVTGSQWPRSE